jgi:predicted helicase
LVSLWVAEAEKPNDVLVLLPSLALISQIFTDWASETIWCNVAYMRIYSDKSVGKSDDSPMFDQTDLDFKVTTDADKICGFLVNPHDGTRVVFSTYQSSKVVAEGIPKGFQRDSSLILAYSMRRIKKLVMAAISHSPLRIRTCRHISGSS